MVLVVHLVHPVIKVIADASGLVEYKELSAPLVQKVLLVLQVNKEMMARKENKEYVVSVARKVIPAQ